MPRRVQDIVPGDHRSIRNIPLGQQPSQKAREEKPRTSSRYEIPDDQPEKKPSREGREIHVRKVPISPPVPPQKIRSGRSGKWIVVIIGIVAVVAGAGYVASAYFSYATFTIVPTSVPVSINGTYIAQSASGSELTYQLATVSMMASTSVAATNGPSISTKAKGTVTLYNSYSATTQRLIAGTRFSDADGHIYRLKSSVAIPGKTASAPGSILATIEADQAGEAYNVSKNGSVSDLKIVAYKGSDKYENIYARPASDITGGFIGSKKIVAPALLASTTALLKARLTEVLLEQAKDAIPSGHIMYNNLHIENFSAPVVSGNDPSQATITLQGTLTGIFFEKDQLINRLAKGQASRTFGDFPYTTPGLENLEVVIANTKDFSPQKKNGLILRIKGDLTLVGSIPVEEIKTKLAGVPLGKTQDIFKPYEAVIKTGSGELVPPWAHVPTDLSRISIVVHQE